MTLSKVGTLVAGVVLSMTGAGRASAPGQPDFTIKTQAGQNITLSKLRGKVVVVNFFGVWCAPCKQELPWLDGFSKKYADKGVVVLGAVEESGGWTRVAAVKQKLGISYEWGMDPDDSFTRFNTDGLPSTVVIDRLGKVRYVHAGLISTAEVERAIQASL